MSSDVPTTTKAVRWSGSGGLKSNQPVQRAPNPNVPERMVPLQVVMGIPPVKLRPQPVRPVARQGLLTIKSAARIAHGDAVKFGGNSSTSPFPRMSTR
ncbi:uncharacterized protein RAG0_15811 [Rhynchosporium agropyri]|uniref:Uncharacterized protein n=2 Tax=Rhynchosporium TaxID=38037 RepID=A0A1E1MIK9_RHYSE|nr:uncharacterized protein RAG0_15811 [Rhynchosporium agropyri]CZT48930.1 uncharacterized protein RSE6_09699 [Rhynchosporium secalis]